MTTSLLRTAVVDIYPGDILARLRHLENRYEAARRTEALAGPRLNHEIPESVEIAREHTALLAEAEEVRIGIELQALPRKVFKELFQKHPPREGNATDQEVGVNDETFPEALVPPSLVDQSWVERLDEFSDVDFERLYLQAFHLNRSEHSAPKALRVSPLSQPNGETSS